MSISNFYPRKYYLVRRQLNDLPINEPISKEEFFRILNTFDYRKFIDKVDETKPQISRLYVKVGFPSFSRETITAQHIDVQEDWRQLCFNFDNSLCV